MSVNGVWELVEFLENYKEIGCKWVFKTNKDSDGNIERFKAKLVVKGFIQKEEERIIVCINFSNTRYQKLTLNNAHA